mmetsp:Transcript_17115/g.51216  ORF Transcript_17115/g.51216 Transcript_17115/m.51216 type:complete len:344 (-) Transcript_17115:377-1408(-)
MALLGDALSPTMSLHAVLGALCGVSEYDELPVRHNEDSLNMGLSQQVRWQIDRKAADDPHAKASLLLQAHLGRTPLPISDYFTDTRTVLDNSLRILQAMVDVCAEAGWLNTAITIMRLVQGLLQARWPDESALLMLPEMDRESVGRLERAGWGALTDLLRALQGGSRDATLKKLRQELGAKAAEEVVAVAARLPDVEVRWGRPTPAAPTRQQLDEAEDGGAEVEPALAVSVTLHRHSTGRGGASTRVYAPRFPKVKEEGWWLVVSDQSDTELLALKRLSFSTATTVRLTFPAAAVNAPGGDGGGGDSHREDECVVLHLISDSYLGLDQRHTVRWASTDGADGK